MTAKITVREALGGPDPKHKLYDIAVLEMGNGPEVSGLKDAGVARNPLPTPSEPLAFNVEQLASSIKGRVDLMRGVSKVIFDHDPEKVVSAKSDLWAWNMKNPEAKIIIAPNQIARRLRAMYSTKAQRFVKSAPKEMRGQAAREIHQ